MIDRIAIKILMFVYKCMNDLAPAYLTELLEPVSHARYLHSTGQNLLKVPRTSTVSYGDHSFLLLWSQALEQSYTKYQKL